MRAVVLMKQVPDLRAGSVGLREDGTIDRASASTTTNPADLHALEAGLQLAEEVWAMSMGPPQAESTLREALSLGADGGVLLCDRVFAGSDTWATANVLAAGIRHLGEIDLVLCGTSALDGETGQVGPQVAERLGLPQATGCEAIEDRDDSVEVRRIVEGGFERLAVPLPAVLTVAETGFQPRYATLPGRRRAAAAEVTVWTAADIGLGSELAGLEASPTKVAHMRPVPVARTTCRVVGEGISLEELAAEIIAVVRGGGTRSDKVLQAEEQTGAMQSAAPSHGGDIWVVCEFVDGELGVPSRELLSKALDLARGTGGRVVAACLGAGIAAAARSAGEFGADEVLVADDVLLDPYRCEPFARVLTDAIRGRRPDVVLFSATTTGRDLAPRMAAALDTGLAADCTDLRVADWQRRGETYRHLLHQERPAMSGSVVATCVCPESRPQMATVRPGMFSPLPRPGRGEVTALHVELGPSDLRVEVLERSVQRGEVALADADVVVAGGAGCDSASWHLVEDLAAAIGGRVAASRGAVEAGLAPRSVQVGQTGSSVAPRLYVACGISGALQHVVGMRRAGTVVAVNRDADAPIFSFADYGIVGDVRDVLPRLAGSLEALG
ncbi:MAG: hypothetical protein DYH08_13105 [Actinobacteria bacterium ATB1]|nr:hypothetical protein [Actinobacteria bacterium ATB1]